MVLGCFLLRTVRSPTHSGLEPGEYGVARCACDDGQQERGRVHVAQATSVFAVSAECSPEGASVCLVKCVGARSPANCDLTMPRDTREARKCEMYPLGRSSGV